MKELLLSTMNYKFRYKELNILSWDYMFNKNVVIRIAVPLGDRHIHSITRLSLTNVSWRN